MLQLSPEFTQQKAQLLLDIANAVEESNARKRHFQHKLAHNNGGFVDTIVMDALIDDLESAAGGKATTVHAGATCEDRAATATSTLNRVTSSLESADNISLVETTTNTAPTSNCGKGTGDRSNPEQLQKNLPQFQFQGQGESPSNNISGKDRVPVDHHQIQLLYSAMISFRENADLRYQLLELRHLDLRKAFVELETRYRKVQAQEEAWRKSCQIMQQAAVEEGKGKGGVAHSKGDDANKCPLQAHTVPVLQKELRSLSAQRNQLMQANLELRKQLKHVQMLQTQQQKNPDKNNGNCCQRCHPQLFEVHQKQVDLDFNQMVEHNPTTAPDRQTLHSDEDEDEEEKEPNRRVGESNSNFHQIDKDQSLEVRMNMMGMRLGSSRKMKTQTNRERDEFGESIRKQKSTRWSPPSLFSAVDGQHHSIIHNNQSDEPLTSNAQVVARMTPTLTSFLPIRHKNKQSSPENKTAPTIVQDIQFSPRRATAKHLSSATITGRQPQDIELSPSETTCLEIPTSSRTEIQHNLLPGVKDTAGATENIEVVTPEKEDCSKIVNNPKQAISNGKVKVLTSTSTLKTNLTSHGSAESATPLHKANFPFRKRKSSQQRPHGHHQQQRLQQLPNTQQLHHPEGRHVVQPQQHVRSVQRHHSAGVPSVPSKPGPNDTQLKHSPQSNGSHPIQSLTMRNARHWEFAAPSEEQIASPMRSKALRQHHAGRITGRGTDVVLLPPGLGASPGSSNDNATGRHLAPHSPRIAPTTHRGGLPPVVQQPSATLLSNKNNEEKAAPAPKPQSRFQRIKNALRQEI